jgi:DNA primase catalytic core
MARIPESEIERLKASLSLVRLMEAAGHTLVKQGKDWALRCPLHEGDDTPSCIVTPGKNVWHCFGCQRGGSVIDWVMATRHVSFRHAVELLQRDSPALVASPLVAVRTAAVAFTPNAEGVALLGQVIEHYHATLQESSEARAYLNARGLDHPELVAHFRLGYANRTLGYRLPEKNRVAGAELRGALQRIGVLRESGHEHFAGSLVIPVFDTDGNVAEVYGRKLRDDLRVGTPKHLYLPGPHRGVFNDAGLIGQEEVILCEALIDALTFWCAGYRNVTSAYGVDGFTEDMLAAFQRHGIKRVLIAFDADAAGTAAAEKLAPRLRAEGFECYRCRFPTGLDANAYALAVKPASQALGLVIRQAEWLGHGAAPKRTVRGAVASESPAIAALPLAAASSPTPVREGMHVENAPSPLPALPAYRVPPSEAVLPVEIDAKELRLTLGDRHYTVRGIEKNVSYEQLKVWLRAGCGNVVHVDTVELYQARQRTAWAKQTAIELGLSEEAVKSDLGSLLRAVEQRQDELIRQRLAPKEAAASAAIGTPAQQGAALALLRDPKLTERIIEDVSAIGVVGEDANALVGYLACVSRKLDKPLAVLIQSTSAAGKSTLMDALLSLMPENERVHYSAMTGQSLFYLGEGDLKHKILAIAEEEGVRQAAYALKLLQSQGELSIASTGKDPVTGKLVTEEYRVEGPVMLFLTTTAIDLDEELQNRCLVLTINESREQTEAIHRRQREARTLPGLVASKQGAALRALHQAAQSVLKPLAVVNPFAEALTFRSESTRMRRDHAKYLTLIDAIAFLHQYQRPVHTATVAGEVVAYVEVTLDDIALANRLAHEVLGRSLDELPPQTRRLLGLIVEHVAAQALRQALAPNAVRFTRKDVRPACGITDTALRLHLERLVELDILIVHRGGFGSRFVYELAFDGDAQADCAHLIGLIDVSTLRTGPPLPPQTLTSHPAQANLTPAPHPENTRFTPALQGPETPLIASTDAGASSLVAAVEETSRHRTAQARRRNGSAAVAGG